MRRITTFKDLFNESFFIYKHIHDAVTLNEYFYSLDDTLISVVGSTVNIVESQNDIKEIENLMENYLVEFTGYTDDNEYLYLYIVTGDEGGPLYFINKSVTNLETLIP
jgi:hypothetical protein